MKPEKIQTDMYEALKLLKTRGLLNRYTSDSDTTEEAKRKARLVLVSYEEKYGKRCEICDLKHSGDCSRIQGEGCNCDEQQCGPVGRGCDCKCHWKRQEREKAAKKAGS